MVIHTCGGKNHFEVGLFFVIRGDQCKGGGDLLNQLRHNPDNIFLVKECEFVIGFDNVKMMGQRGFCRERGLFARKQA